MLNDRIRKLRKALDLTQQEFADRLGVKRNTVATYEIGRSEPIDAVFSLICREFSVNEEWLRTGEGEMFLRQTREDEIAAAVHQMLFGESSDFKRRLIAVLSKLKDEQWIFLEDKMREILDARPVTSPSDSPHTAKALPPDADLSEKVLALEKQNRELMESQQKLMEKLEAMEKEDAELEAQETAARIPSWSL